MATDHKSPIDRFFHELIVLSAASLACGTANAQQDWTFQTSAGPVRAQVVADGLQHPWAIDFLPDGRMLVTERAGTMRIVENGEPGAPIEGVPEVYARGQGGLLDVELAPDFAQSGRIYFSYAEPGAAIDTGGAGTAVMAARLMLEGDSGRLEERNVIFRMNRYTDSNIHFGSRIAIARDGNLFITLGERGQGERGQDPADLAGAVVRIAPDGTIPADNPFAGAGMGNPAIWSIGHRNPQGATIRPSDGSLWIVEHGAQGGDEVNKPRPGANYGWPVIAYGQHYGGGQIGEGTSKPGMEQPIYYWDPSIAPSGLDFVEGELFSAWEGDMLVGALSFELVSRLEMEGDRVVNEERLFEGAFGRIRDVTMGPDGAIYLATDESRGQVIRVAPAE